ncbi:MAG: family efflux transporter [Pelosinus sp.]|nr:family efflux transporter [Pelosinus sp.]
MQKINDMTKGAPFNLYVRFSIPMILSNVFYQLYILVDGIVASRLIGLNAFAAISAAGFFYLFILEAVMGFSQGAGIRFAQLYGAKRYDEARNSTAISIMLAFLIGAFLSILCFFITIPVLTAMNTPKEIIKGSVTYLYCMFAGLIPTFLYKIVSSIFFGMGDSKTPLVALILGSIIDTVFTIVLVLVTPLGVAAIGISTILSQLVACMYLFLHMFRNKEMRLSRGYFRIRFTAVSELLGISLPICARNAVSALGGVVIQYVVNGYGVAFIAGVAAAKRLYIILFIIADAMEPAIGTFIAQNFGARKFIRVKDGMQTAKRIMLISSISIMVLMFVIGQWFLSLMIGNDAEIAMVSKVALGQLRVCLLFLPMLYLLILYRSGLQGMGKTTTTLVSGIIEGGLRIVAIFLLPLFLGKIGVYITEVIAWPVCAVQLFFAYSVAYRQELQAKII